MKPDNIATFLGKKLSPQFEGEAGNRYNIRIEGTRIKHTMGPVSLKLYDKFSLILRIETTVNDLTFFKHYREVEHRDGTKETKWADMQKTIYSLPALRELLDLLCKHIQESHGRGASMKEFEQVLPALSRRQIKVLIQELRTEGKIRSEGERRGTKWYLGVGGIGH